MRRFLRLLAVYLCGCLCAKAGVISLTGNLDPGNPNDVLLFEINLAAPGSLIVESWGFAGGTNAAGVVIPAGGFDPYVSLFQGAGPVAVFLTSNDDKCPDLDDACRDSRLELSGLAPGVYTIALGVFLNMSIAENYGGGTLGDGFTGLGSYYDWTTGSDRSSAYAIDITGDITSVPEPSPRSSLCLVAAISLIWLRRHASGPR
ncbi:DVUA0089 family protein [Paludibaculum fermentans]|uniref:DVUA0089 family protein n=1 Tax=Paludibaculum fermentans TaxID=1473598 RepID=UPI003EBB374F